MGYKRVFFSEGDVELSIFDPKDQTVEIEIIDREESPTIGVSIILSKEDVHRMLGLLEAILNNMK